MMISSFEALTLLPPDKETFICFGGVSKYGTQNLEDLHRLAIACHTASIGLKRFGKSMRLGFQLGGYWFPTTKERVNRMLEPYGYELAGPLKEDRR